MCSPADAATAAANETTLHYTPIHARHAACTAMAHCQVSLATMLRQPISTGADRLSAAHTHAHTCTHKHTHDGDPAANTTKLLGEKPRKATNRHGTDDATSARVCWSVACRRWAKGGKWNLWRAPYSADSLSNPAQTAHSQPPANTPAQSSCKCWSKHCHVVQLAAGLKSSRCVCCTQSSIPCWWWLATAGCCMQRGSGRARP